MATAAERLRREGWIEGEREGKRGPLLLLLRQRFGALPAAVTARIEQAGAAELDAWFGRVLSASSLDEVLATKARRKT
jgi:DNA-binding transcriptional regulator PaaX